MDARAASGNPLKAEILSSLPAAGTKGRVVFNTGDNKFYFDNGSAWNVAAVANIGQQTITPTTTNQTITEGYHDGTGYAEGDADLVAGNIKDGVTIFGVTGDFPIMPRLEDMDYLLLPSDLHSVSWNEHDPDDNGEKNSSNEAGVGIAITGLNYTYHLWGNIGDLSGFTRMHAVIAYGGRAVNRIKVGLSTDNQGSSNATDRTFLDTSSSDCKLEFRSNIYIGDGTEFGDNSWLLLYVSSGSSSVAYLSVIWIGFTVGTI